MALFVLLSSLPLLVPLVLLLGTSNGDFSSETLLLLDARSIEMCVWSLLGELDSLAIAMVVVERDLSSAKMMRDTDNVAIANDNQQLVVRSVLESERQAKRETTK